MVVNDRVRFDLHFGVGIDQLGHLHHRRGGPDFTKELGVYGPDPAIFGLPSHNRQVRSLDCVRAKLQAEIAFRLGGPREDQEAARVLVKSVNRLYLRGTALAIFEAFGR